HSVTMQQVHLHNNKFIRVCKLNTNRGVVPLFLFCFDLVASVLLELNHILPAFFPCITPRRSHICTTPFIEYINQLSICASLKFFFTSSTIACFASVSVSAKIVICLRQLSFRLTT